MAPSPPSQQAKPPSSPSATPRGGGLVDALKQIRLEAGRITWPTRAQIWGNTVVVVVMVTLVSLGILLVDNLFFGLIWLLTDALPKQLMH